MVHGSCYGATKTIDEDGATVLLDWPELSPTYGTYASYMTQFTTEKTSNYTISAKEAAKYGSLSIGYSAESYMPMTTWYKDILKKGQSTSETIYYSKISPNEGNYREVARRENNASDLAMVYGTYGDYYYASDLVFTEADDEKLINDIYAGLSTVGRDYLYMTIQNYTKTYSGSRYNMNTSYEFAKSYEEVVHWSKRTMGTANNAIGAAFNLYDNRVYFPKRETKTILVRHVDLGSDNVLGEEIVDDISGSNILLDIEQSSSLINYEGKKYSYILNNRLTNNGVRVLKEANGKSLTCIGYNRASGNTVAGVQQQIKTSRKNNSHIEYNGKTHIIASSDAKFTIVEVYYNNTDAATYNIFANHYIIDDSGNIKGTLSGNDSAAYTQHVALGKTMSGTLPNIIATSSYADLYQELYSPSRSQKVTLKSVSNSNYICVGYKTSYQKITDSSGRTSGTEHTVSPGKNNYVAFFYKQTNGANYDGKIPTINIGGKLTTTSLNKIYKNCDGIYSVPAQSLTTNDNDVEIYLKNNVYKYILGGLNLEKVTNGSVQENQELTITFKSNFGNNVSGTNEYSIPYDYAYYRAKDMLIYEATTLSIYDAATGMTTKGDRMLDSALKNSSISTNEKIEIYDRNENSLSYSSSGNYKNLYSSYVIANGSEAVTTALKNIFDSCESEVDINQNEGNYFYFRSNLINDDTDWTMSRVIPSTDIGVSTSRSMTGDLESGFDITYSIQSSDFENADLDKNGNITAHDVEEAYNETIIAESIRIENEIDSWESDYETYSSMEINDAYEYVGMEEDKKNSSETEKKYKCPDGYSPYTGVVTSTGDSGGEIKKDNQCAKRIGYEWNDTTYDTYRLAQQAKKDELESIEDRCSQVLANVADRLDAAFEQFSSLVQDIEAADRLEQAMSTLAGYSAGQMAYVTAPEVTFEYSNAGVTLDDTNLVSLNKATKTVNVTKSGSSYVIKNNGTTVGTVLLETQRPEAKTSWYENGFGTITKDDFSNNDFKIDKYRLNGVRYLASTLYYDVDTSNSLGSPTSGFDDNYYNKIKNYNSGTTTNFASYIESKYSTSVMKITKEYNYIQKNVDPINVYEPIEVEAEFVSLDEDTEDRDVLINHSNKDNVNTIVQQNSNFSIRFSSPKSNLFENEKSDYTSKYRYSYYIKFTFDVIDVSADGKIINNGSKISAGTWIGPIYGNQITARAYITTTSGSLTDTGSRYSYVARAFAHNATSMGSSWIESMKRYSTIDDITDSNIDNVCGDAYIAESEDYVLTLINRVYDFRVTDLADISWKNIFRTTSGSNVNDHTGIVYYAGSKKLTINYQTLYNKIENRTTSEVGINPVRILPLGPYKNTDTTYVYAPKLGYRFSFDFKVTGSHDASSYATIIPKFYYISKHGTKNIDADDGLVLMYKNAAGNYARISEGTNTIYMQPGDGYRLLDSYGESYLSNSNISLGNYGKIILKASTNTTEAINKGVQTFYGEYKLPASTIATMNGNVSQTLKDGYIGVVFNISYKYGDTIVSYNQNDKNAEEGKEVNTSQWDFEGYLGATAGFEHNATIRLEKGIWRINNARYQDIKGTVILYDTDSSAAIDFD